MENKDPYILIAGGTGLLGKAITKKFREDGRRVRILTRGKTDEQEGLFHWNPEKDELDTACLENVSVIINLSGTGVADKRWTAKRKAEIIDSRVDSTTLLFRHAKNVPTLRQYITASGINCYGYDKPGSLHKESDPFGTDFLSEVVKRWETAADQFSTICPVAKIRLGTVLSGKGGALPAIAKPVKLGFGSKMGSGQQMVPWIHIDDAAGIFEWVAEHRLEGPYNAVAGNVTNKELIRQLARTLHRPLWMPRVPAGFLKLLLGEMSELVLRGVGADHSSILETGFSFRFTKLDQALESIYCC